MSRTLKLEIENASSIDDPSLEVLEQVVSTISPRGPSFFILSDHSGSYVQVAGARLRLTVEHRHVTPFGFRHFVLGREPIDDEETSINYSGGAIRLRRSEILSLPRAIEILRMFHENGSVPSGLTQRETTDMLK